MKDGLVQLLWMEKSIRQKWVNRMVSVSNFVVKNSETSLASPVKTIQSHKHIRSHFDWIEYQLF